MLPEDDPRDEQPPDREEYEAAMKDREANGPPAPIVGKYTQASAVISVCQNFRYALTRRWRDDKAEPVTFVMLNPSTANGSTDDPTIRRCVGFAKDWGYSGLVVVNLFAFRATEPRALLTAPDIIGPDNDKHIVEQCAGRLVVAAWGATPYSIFGKDSKCYNRAADVLKLIRERCCTDVNAIALTPAGFPRHPLYLKADLRPTAYMGMR